MLDVAEKLKWQKVSNGLGNVENIDDLLRSDDDGSQFWGKDWVINKGLETACVNSSFKKF